MPPVVAAGLQVDGRSGSLVDDDMLHARAGLERFLDCGKKFDFSAAAISSILRDDGCGLRVVDAIDQSVGREPAEDDRVRRADAGASQHGDGELGSHAHVNCDPVAFFHAERFQNVGELLHLAMELLIREHADFAGLTFPDEGSLVLAPGLSVTVEAVVREIDVAADKPFGPGAIPVENLVPRLEPVQLAGDTSPKLFGIVDGLLVEALIVGEALDVRLLAEFRGRIELPLFLQDGINAGGLRIDNSLVRHDVTSTPGNPNLPFANAVGIAEGYSTHRKRQL